MSNITGLRIGVAMVCVAILSAGVVGSAQTDPHSAPGC